MKCVSSGVPRCLTPISYWIHQDRFVPARRALEGTLFEARSRRREACNPHVFAAYRTRTACDWKLGLNGGLRCVHGYYPHVLPIRILRCARKENLFNIAHSN